MGRTGYWDRCAIRAGYQDWSDYKHRLRTTISMAGLYRNETGNTVKPASGGGGLALCPFHDDRNPSLSLLPDDTGFKCHALSCGLTGDQSDFISRLKGWGFARATHWLAREAGLNPVRIPGSTTGGDKDSDVVVGNSGRSGRVATIARPAGTGQVKPGETGKILVPPAEQLPGRGDRLQAWNPVKGRTVMVSADHWHIYRNREGNPLLLVGRMDARPGKSKRFFRLTWRQGKDHTGWWLAGWPTRPTPLYGLPILELHTAEIIVGIREQLNIVVVEGEKTRDAGHRLLHPDYCVLSALGSGNSVGHGHWGLLHENWQKTNRNRSGEPASIGITVWPDADWVTPENNPPARFAEAVQASLLKHFGRDTFTFRIVWPEPDWPRGFDLADLEPGAATWVRQQLWRASYYERVADPVNGVASC